MESDFRIVKCRIDGFTYYKICEVQYDESGNPFSCYDYFPMSSESVRELKEDLSEEYEMIKEAFFLPSIDEDIFEVNNDNFYQMPPKQILIFQEYLEYDCQVYYPSCN